MKIARRHSPFAALFPALLLALSAAACSGGHPAHRGRGRVLVLGLDGMDHGIVRQMLQAGQLPRLASLQSFQPLETSTPPQSPTAWSNFITGMSPGYHGIFDFVHRDPWKLRPYLSTSRVDPPRCLNIGSWGIPLGGGGPKLLRRQKPFWWYLDRAGVRATVIRMPSHFPPRDDGGARVLSGMGTPDLLGTYGTFSVLTTDAELAASDPSGGQVVELERAADDVLVGTVPGPMKPCSSEEVPLEVGVAVDAGDRGALITAGGARVLLGVGQWSELVRMRLPLPGPLGDLSAVGRLYLKSLQPEVVLYLSPLNIDPLDPALPISSPPDFAARLARRSGLYYTQGMPEDSKALAAGVLTEDEYLQQAEMVLRQRERMLKHALQDFREGFLFFYFSSSDQIAHMFFRAHDRTHPARTSRDDRHANVLRDLYRRMDRVVGEVQRKLRPGDLLLVISDHGFGPASYLFDLNGWLEREGYLVLRDEPQPGFLGHIDWRRTQAYGLGLNGLYLNLAGRERHGVVDPRRRDQLLRRLTRALLAVRQPTTGQRVVTEVTRPRKLYPGPEVSRAPDLVLGYGRGFKVADESATGGVSGELFAINRHAWSGDHCGDHRLVPGILFSNQPLRRVRGGYNLKDLAPTVLRYLGVRVPATMRGRSMLEQGDSAPSKTRGD
jgi:predicted AlkP superfamily phosphohydrolase/phosphomutase